MMGRGLVFLYLFAAMNFSLAAGSAGAEQLVLPGTGASEVVLKKLAAAFNNENPGDAVVIPPSVGSGGGIRLVGTGEHALGRVARPIKGDELAYDLEYLVFARDMIVFAVGPKVGIKTLSSQQLADIFSGKVESWQQVGGNDKQVRLLIREPDDSSLLIIRKKLDSFTDLRFSEKAKILFHDHEMVNALNKFSTAMGWLTNSSMLEVNAGVTTIAIDNIAPTRENVLAGKYLLAGDYALVFKKGGLAGLAKRFVDFIFSQKASRIMIDMGLVPVNQKQH